MQKKLLAIAVAGALPSLPLPRFAEFGPVESLTMTAGADLSSYQYRAVRASAERTVNVASHATNSALIGVLQNNPQSGEMATVGYSGRSKVVAGGSIDANAFVTTNGSGKAVAAASGDMVLGRAIDAAAADDVFQCLLQPPFRLSGAI